MCVHACVCMCVHHEPTCDKLCRLRGAAGTGLVVRYDRQGVVLSTVHGRDEAETQQCGCTVLAICGQGHIFLCPLDRTPVHGDVQRATRIHLDKDHVRSGRTWKEEMKVKVWHCTWSQPACLRSCVRVIWHTVRSSPTRPSESQAVPLMQ